MNLYNIDPSKEVIITKLAESKPGLVEIGFWSKGTLISGLLPEVGKSFWMNRDEDSEKIWKPKGEGFNTSTVNKLIPTAHGVALITRNSVWLLENTQ